MPQEIALYPLLSPRENLWTFGRYQGLVGRRPLDAAIRASLDWIGLADRADEKTDKLSGGMKRRLNIAAGTIHGPRVLLLDEPTVGVDPQSRERIYAMIGELKAPRRLAPLHDALHGRGRAALRPHRDHRPRQDHRRGNQGRARAADARHPRRR